MFNINLGKFLAQLRVENKLTQEKLAEMLHIDKRKISRWECGNSPPEFELLIKLSEIFKVTLYELSICQRLKDEALIEKTKKKLRTIKDLKKISIKRKIGLFLSIIFGIFLGISAVYTIDNYNTVEIYTLKSLDKNFRIEGSYIKAKNYDIFNVTKLGCTNNYSENFNIDVNNIEYEVLNSNKKSLFIIEVKGTTSHNNLLNTLNNTSFYKENFDYRIYKDNILFFSINYKIDKEKRKSIEFKFKLVKKFQNIF